jgi:hypothetical protein
MLLYAHIGLVSALDFYTIEMLLLHLLYVTDILISRPSAFLREHPGASPGNARATTIYYLSKP